MGKYKAWIVKTYSGLGEGEDVARETLDDPLEARGGVALELDGNGIANNRVNIRVVISLSHGEGLGGRRRAETGRRESHEGNEEEELHF